MKRTPPLTAGRSVGPPVGVYATAPTAAAPTPHPGAAVRPMASVSCLTGCVGAPAAIRCGNKCGSDLSCWRTCAGISNTSCVASCLRN
ncbi:hypothetical protein [Streptomyces pseudovenezuelae]|uniref:Uncharacterized protein n=1 Tax=Streptomyces pseudovenezuelae TaxID=67350 RepID=A0ABT6LZ29_9ACTN|nr:hypothetical protein [Streptomyces pseudovenezuelae]MDH6221555.1 hypothetical protein [Streptomyces pseudovenezuelae]